MLENIVDIDHASMVGAMECDEAAIILFDFSAAFPSVSRRFLLRAAREAGLPDQAMNVLSGLYLNTVATILLRGELCGEVPMGSGIRQGCPLSPLLFALASDSLLRILDQRHPGAVTRAFADDTAMVLRSWRLQGRRVMRTFAAFRRVSGLALNLEKTIVIPLWEEDLGQLAARAAEEMPEFAVQWASHGRYLGYQIGPGRGERTWDKPKAKYEQRLREWDWSAMGLQAALDVYNIYVLPVLTFVAQLSSPPEAVLSLERTAVRRVAPGPGEWCQPADLHHAPDWGLARPMRPMQATCTGAMLRAHAWEGSGGQRIRWGAMAASLRRARAQTNHVVRAGRWAPWLDAHMAMCVHAAAERHQETGVGMATLRREVAGVAVGPLDRTAAMRLKKGTQRWFVKQVLKRSGCNQEERLSKLMARWRLPGLQGRVVRETLRNLRSRRRLVPPRVAAAVMRTILNAWVTDRRMRGLRDGRQDGCRLGCADPGADHIEHYLACPILRGWCGTRGLREVRDQRREVWFLACDVPRAHLVATARVLYVVYRAVHHLRHRPGTDATYRRHLLDQLWVEARGAGDGERRS